LTTDWTVDTFPGSRLDRPGAMSAACPPMLEAVRRPAWQAMRTIRRSRPVGWVISSASAAWAGYPRVSI